MTNVCAVFMRAGTDQVVVDKMYDVLNQILTNEKFLATADNIGVNIDIKNGEEVKAYIDSCMEKAEKYAKLVQ